MSGLSPTEARTALVDLLSEVRAGMLGIEGSDQHSQPMTQYYDDEKQEVWFIASVKSDLVAAVGTGAMARLTATGADQRCWASLKGPIEQSTDSEKLDEIWSIVAAAWFDQGREDPDICLLHMTLTEAAVWTATSNPIVFGLEVARANLSQGHEPDVGGHAVINFV